jgi:histidyl-tRNA synthetase
MQQSTKPPAGTRDFLPDEVRRRHHVIDVVRSVYERYAFEPLETPAYENIDTLLGKYGDEGSKLIFKILKRGEHESSGEADLALRYDLTVPFARIVAQYQNELPRFFKRYQIQPVWRAERPARGRFREFYQCDVDAIGSTSITVEVELISAVADVLSTLGFSNFTIRLNDRRVLTAMLNEFGVQPTQHNDVLVAIDKLDKIGVDGVSEELATRNIDPKAAGHCVDFFRRVRELPKGQTGQLWFLDSVSDAPGVEDLRTILGLVEGTAAAGRVRVDPSLARGLSYYTGAIMEIAVPDLAGSLGGGGRYDNLIGMFLGRDVPACGFSLGLERIILVMTERQMFPPRAVAAPVDVMVTIWSDALREDALALARDLRQAGIRVDVYPEAEKLGKQFKHAASRQVRFVAIIGDDEKASQKVTIKDMTSGEQQTVNRQEIASYVKGRLQ